MFKFDTTNDSALSALEKDGPKQKGRKKERSIYVLRTELRKELRKAIKNRERPRNKFLRARTEESEKRLNRQTNFYVGLFRKMRIFFRKTRQ